MKTKILISLAIFLGIGIASLLSHLFDWYDIWYTDIILHTLAGTGFVFLWSALQKGKVPLFLFILGSASAATLGSVLWELGELGAWHFIPAYTPKYSPNFFDTIGDITCGMIGGFISAFFVRQK